MKNFTLIILLTMATLGIFGQGYPDQVQILQQCIDLPDLQQYYKMDAEGSMMPICILQHGVSFPSDIEVYKFGRRVQLLTKPQIADMAIDSYFLFWEFKTDENSAKVDFVYNYVDSGNIPRMQQVSLKLQKSHETWVVESVNMEEK